ncbi:lysine-specific metallo-endopeptidase domain-containing protein [Purpureocillium lavendulum]|uniref:Lysine-specific metallo-endopeptidase domain-containing protein n=1 Tax=Purpureocillium lavendulum TaxID=1247861 RepID=A0AB34G7G0_9HYPO|nr:lysine-specific metallo-endopeptidase domain-containing protein [Purpureocillium lavendulum]
MKCTSSWVLVVSGLGSLTQAASLIPRKWHFDGNSCDAGKQKILKDEFKAAALMASVASLIPKDDLYYKTFISDLHQSMGEGFLSNIHNGYSRISEMVQENAEGYEVKVTCNDATDGCKKKWFAHMNDGKKTMNFCDRFFDSSKGIVSTQERLDNCDKIDLREAQRSRSAIIVHEASHTKYAMLDTDRTKDYAYGFNGCYLLARGGFNRDCVPYKGDKVLCPDSKDKTKESFCPAELEMKNADTWSFIAAGFYFSKACKRTIPLPPLPQLPGKPPKSARRDTGNPILARASLTPKCRVDNDYLVIDGSE